MVALDDGRVGGDRSGGGVGGEGHPDAYGDGLPGGDGDPGERVAEDADLLVAVGALPGDPVLLLGAAGFGELQLDLVRSQPPVAVGEHEDRVQGLAGGVGGVGEVEEPGAVSAAGGVPVRGVLDPGLDGEVLGLRVTAHGLFVVRVRGAYGCA
ncbi:hypothetical protein [Streptomyces rubiginosohelvolus]|uniref:hypothetical protein n=1 Tax=Streptomyces rubiginosohelvolus TaxID=67362 RepID=UPI003F4D6F3B